MDYRQEHYDHCSESEQLYEVYEIYDYLKNIVARSIIAKLRHNKICPKKVITQKKSKNMRAWPEEKRAAKEHNGRT